MDFLLTEDVRTIDATVYLLRLGCTLRPASLSVSPIITWSTIVERISLHRFGCLLLCACPTPPPGLPLPIPLGLFLHLVLSCSLSSALFLFL